MEKINIIGTSKPLKYPSSGLLQVIFTSRKPIQSHDSSPSSLKPPLNRGRCDLSMLNHSRNSDSHSKQPTELRKRYSSLTSLPSISATSWCIMDAGSSHWISGHNDIEIREIASLTKIMTCLVCLNILKQSAALSLQTTVKVSYKASSMIGTSAGLRSCDRLTVRDLLFALMLPSGNDAAWALAEFFGMQLAPSSIKPVKHFTAEMNKTARELNLDGTYFANPHGLMYKKNVSCARDVAKTACYALKDEVFRNIVDTKKHIAEVKGSDGMIRFLTWENTNKLLGHGFNGVKTGVTDNAGPCLCVSFKKLSTIVLVLLNSRTMDDRWIEAKRLAEWVSGRY
jgi:D-alanyl-D-alanine carboxypeptidase